MESLQRTTDIGETLAVVGSNGWRCCICNSTFPRAISIEHHMITTHTSPPLSTALCARSVTVPSPASTRPHVVTVSLCQTSADSSCQAVDTSSISSISKESDLSSRHSLPTTSISSQSFVSPSSSLDLSGTLSARTSARADSTEAQPEDMEGINTRFDSMYVTGTKLPLSSDQSSQPDGEPSCPSHTVDGQPSFPTHSSVEAPFLHGSKKIVKWACECGDFFESKQDIKLHHRLSGCHVKYKLFFCQSCGEGFHSKQEMKSHFKTSDCLTTQRLKTFVCPVCREGFAYKRGLNRHLETKCGQVFPCPDCTLQFHSQQDLQTHRKETHTIKLRISVPQSDQDMHHSSQDCHSQNHRMCTNGNSKIDSSITALHLGKHSAVHEDARTKFLNRVYDSGSDFNGGTQWECPKCKRNFLHKHVYRSHLKQCGILKVGNGHRSFHCPLCGLEFRWLVRFQQHYFRHHKRETLFTDRDSPSSFSPFAAASPAPSVDSSMTASVFHMVLSDDGDSSDSEKFDKIDKTTRSQSVAATGRCGSRIQQVDNSAQKGRRTAIDSFSVVTSDTALRSLQKNKENDDKEDDDVAVSDFDDDCDSWDSDIEWVSMEAAGQGSAEGHESLASGSNASVGGESEDGFVPPWQGGFGWLKAMHKLGHSFPPPFHPLPPHHHPHVHPHHHPHARPHHHTHPPPPPLPHHLPPPHHPPPPCYRPPPPPHSSPPPPYDFEGADNVDPHQHDWGGFHGFPPFFKHHLRHFVKRKWRHCMMGLRLRHGFFPYWPGWHGRHPHFPGYGRRTATHTSSSHDDADFASNQASASFDAEPASCDKQLKELGSTAGITKTPINQVEITSASANQYTANGTLQASATVSPTICQTTKPSSIEDMKATKEQQSCQNPAASDRGDSRTEERTRTIGQAVQLITSTWTDGKKLWFCPDCLQMFGDKKCLKSHHTSQHTPAVFPCSECGENISDPVIFNKHVRHHHVFQHSGRHHRSHGHHMQDNVGNSSQQTYDNKLYTDPCLVASMCEGLASDPDISGFKECPICKKKFRASSRPEFFERHVNSHLGIDTFNFKCKECGRTFLEKSKFLSHLLTHGESQAFTCQTCGKSYQNKTSLTRHERVHSGEHPHVCPDCGEGFFEHRALVRHRATHTGQAAFECPHCKAGFTLRASMVNHIRSKHTGEKPFTCDCSKSFPTSSALSRHRKTCPDGDGVSGKAGEEFTPASESHDGEPHVLMEEEEQTFAPVAVKMEPPSAE